MAVNAIWLKPTQAINTSESWYQCESAKIISSTQNTIEASRRKEMSGFLLVHASQSAESREPTPKADEMRPKPAGPVFRTVVANRGKMILKLMPKSEMVPTTTMIRNTEGFCLM